MVLGGATGAGMTLGFLGGAFMAAGSWRRGPGLVQVGVARLMVLIAVVAVLCWAWLYRRENASLERSWASMQLRDLRHAGAVQRRRAAENLDSPDADDVSRVVSGLAGVLGDPAWQVRRAAARSLARVLQRSAANPGRASIDQVDHAMRALVPALDDPRTEVRIAALRSMGKLGELFRASPVAPGRVVPEAKPIAAALLRAMRDPAISVRAEAVSSLAHLGPSAGIDPGRIKEAVEHDPALEVRTAAMGALFTGWPELSRTEDVPGL
jgi:hypothetical protein